MRITNTDIDALVDTAQVLKNLEDMNTIPTEKARFRALSHHVRKVYILCLHASKREIVDLRQLVFGGIIDDPELDRAINALCPASLATDGSK